MKGLKYYAVSMAIIAHLLFAYKLGVRHTTQRVDQVLNQQANRKLQDSTFWAMAREFPEEVE